VNEGEQDTTAIITELLLTHIMTWMRKVRYTRTYEADYNSQVAQQEMGFPSHSL
jgi:hypothetical protein